MIFYLYRAIGRFNLRSRGVILFVLGLRMHLIMVIAFNKYTHQMV